MSRNFGTNKNGGSFSEEEKRAVWVKAASPKNVSDGSIKIDKCGAAMLWSKYGDTNHVAGWEIDHIKPVSKGGDDDLDNLQALQWQNNRAKGDDHPANPAVYCKIRS